MVKMHNVAIPEVTAFPSNPSEGMLVYKTDELYIYTITNGTPAWKQLSNTDTISTPETCTPQTTNTINSETKNHSHAITGFSLDTHSHFGLIRDTTGKFNDLPLPSFNFFTPDKTLPSTCTFTRGSSASYIDPFGNIKYATTNNIRFDHNPLTGMFLGYRSEASGINIAVNSEELDVLRRLTLTSISGTFQVGETVSGGTGTGIISSIDENVLCLSSISGTFSGTVTGVSSNATGTYSSIATSWSLARVTVTKNVSGVLAPDGSLMDKVVEDTTASNTHYIAQTHNVTAGLTYTLSVFAKAAELTKFRFSFPAGSSQFLSNCQAIFNLSDGTVEGWASLSDYGITNMGNGVYRCWASAVCQTTASALLTIFLDHGGQITYTGDGSSGIYLWGFQIESMDITSYIKTLSTSVSRSADVCTVSLSGIDFNPNEGTVFVDAITPQGYGAFPKCATLYKDVNNALYLDRQRNGIIRCVATTSGTVVAQLNLGVIAHNTRFRAAFSWKTDDFKGVLNGGTAVTDTSGGVPMGLTTLAIGSTPATTVANWNGIIRQLTYFPRALSSAHLQMLTS